MRDPVDDAEGGSSAIDNRCRAENVGEGGMVFGSTRRRGLSEEVLVY